MKQLQQQKQQAQKSEATKSRRLSTAGPDPQEVGEISEEVEKKKESDVGSSLSRPQIARRRSSFM
jgi:hypothetical protein